MNYSSFYLVADHCFECIGSHQTPSLNRVEGFKVFQCEARDTTFRVHINESELELPSDAELLHAFSFEYIHAEFSKIPQGYLFTMRSDHCDQLFIMLIDLTAKQAVCNWELNPDFTLLRFGLWMCLSIFILPFFRVAIHASVIAYDGKAVLFLGESGTGKSTHTALWRKHIRGAILLNDDSPILWAGQDERGSPFAFAYGAPWSGKTPCYKKEMLPVAAIVRLKQAPANNMRRLSKLEAFSALYPSAPPAFAQETQLTDGVCKIISNTIQSVPFYQLECLPDADAAQLACKTIFNTQAPEIEPTSEPKVTTRVLSNELFLDQTKQLLAEGQNVRICPLGNSMLPFLRGGLDQVEISPLERSCYHRFSIVFAQQDQKFIIHRVVGSRTDAQGNKLIILLGDGNFTPEMVPVKNILGVVETVYRKNGTVMRPDSLTARFFALLWYMGRPIRRYLLWLITSRKLPEYLRPWKRES